MKCKHGKPTNKLCINCDNEERLANLTQELTELGGIWGGEKVGSEKEAVGTRRGEMTIDEAIKILEEGQYHLALTLNPDFHNAVKLGVEALERLQDNRKHPVAITFCPLPSETK